MRCKVGDLAVIVSNAPKSAGWLVRVLYAPPAGAFRLPDGYPHLSTSQSNWVVESMVCSQFEVPVNLCGRKATRLARYAAIGDKWLRPIRDSDGDDETLTWAGKPAEIEKVS